jgi:hypothetical protein
MCENHTSVSAQINRNFSRNSEFHKAGASAKSEAPQSAQILGDVELNRGFRED